MAVPHRRQACQTQRRTAAGCTPSARATSPTGRPAPTSPTAWTRTAVGYLDHDLPPSRPPGPSEGPGPVGSDVDAPQRPGVLVCVLAAAASAGRGWAGHVPVGVAVGCPTGLPAAADPAAAVGGWAASQASTAATASVCSWSRRRPASPPSTCTSMINPGGPGRGRRGRLRRWPMAASRAAGVGSGGLGWGMRGSLLTTAAEGWRQWGSVAPGSRSFSIILLDHADQSVRASACAQAAERAAPTTIQCQGCIAARWRCTCAATAAPTHPPAWVPAPQCGWLGSPSAPGSACSPEPPIFPPW
jgi:hypothetical protein